jgi:hypothetical protein
VEMPSVDELKLLAMLVNPELEDLKLMMARVGREEIKAKATSVFNYLGGV